MANEATLQEIADRRSRTNAGDRSLLSERTVRSLRTLANTSRVYSSRFRTHARRSVVNIPEYLAPPANEFEMDEEDDEFEVDATTRIEGTRIPSELHDAYAGGVGAPSPWAIPSSSRRVFSTSPSPSDEWQAPIIRSPSASANTRPWVNINSSSATVPNTLLNRQASIRRAGRTRVDLNERRRWYAREASALVSPRPEAPENVTEPREGLVWNRPLNSQGRRFFPLPRPRRHDSSSSTTGGVNMLQSTWTDADRLSPDAEDSYDRVAAHPWSEPPAFSHPPSPGSEFIGHRYDPDARIYRLPRLRRGGVLAPESMFSRHASPVVVNAESIAVSSSTAAVASTPVVILTPPPPPPPTGTVEVVSPVVPPSYSPPPLPPILAEEPVAYPTPGSTQSEYLS